MNQFYSVIKIFAYNYLKLNLICFNNLNGINLSSYPAFRFVHFFFFFLVELAHAKAAITQIYWIQANTYTENNPYMLYCTNIFCFRCLQERLL